MDDTTNKLVGLARFGIGSARANQPDVYTYVGDLELSAFLDLRLGLDLVGLVYVRMQ